MSALAATRLPPACGTCAASLGIKSQLLQLFLQAIAYHCGFNWHAGHMSTCATHTHTHSVAHSQSPCGYWALGTATLLACSGRAVEDPDPPSDCSARNSSFFFSSRNSWAKASAPPPCSDALLITLYAGTYCPCSSADWPSQGATGWATLTSHDSTWTMRQECVDHQSQNMYPLHPTAPLVVCTPGQPCFPLVCFGRKGSPAAIVPGVANCHSVFDAHIVVCIKAGGR
jgi:hypothetical protein